MDKDIDIDREVMKALIRNADYREAPPDAAYQQVLAAAEATWQDELKKRRRTRNRFFAVAATLVLSVSAGFLLWQQIVRPDTDPLAQVTRFSSTLEFYRDTDRQWLPLVTEAGVNLSLKVNQPLRTGPGGGLAILLNNAVSVRLASHTTFTLLSRDRIRLDQGRLYVDTGDLPGAGHALEVITPSGSVVDIGTQFEVTHNDSLYRVRVRDGQVEFEAGGRVNQGFKGEQLTVPLDSAMDSPVVREPVDPADASWQWVEALASPPAIDGRPLIEALNWIARETGRSLEFASAHESQRANEIILSGDISGLTPLVALDTLLATTELQAQLLDAGTILIRSRD